MTTPTRFRDRRIVLADGVIGEPISFETANPVNFHQAISEPGAAARLDLDGQLFMPLAAGARSPVPLVIVTPGSLGVADSHLASAARLVAAGVAALVIDPFGARGVTSTVANQTQYAFAASGWDVLAALAAVARRPGIDAGRIGAQGHSRGGSAVLTAAMSLMVDAVLPGGPRLRAVYAAYPWSGQQFLNPVVGATRVRAIIGDRDGWCLPQQVQGHIQAIRLAGGDASFRLVAGAAHSFDRETPVEMIPEASVCPSAPTVYIADDGAFIDPTTDLAAPALTDRDLMIYAIGAGYGVRGAAIGSRAGEPALFRADVDRFWREALL